MKELLVSILSGGSASPFFKEFYSICIKMAIAYLSISKNKLSSKELQIKLGITLNDLAQDCISDLFETREDLFIHINNYFHKSLGSDIELLHDDEIKACLAILIKSKTNQQLSELREVFGDIYFKIRKAVSVFLVRNKISYNEIHSNGNRYIYTCTHKEINIGLSKINSESILNELYGIKFHSYQIPEVLRAFFQIVNNQNKFAKVVEYNTLLKTLKIYYQTRLRDREIENVEYFNY
jgi:hypothetical protein